MTTARYIVADVFDGIAGLPDASVDLVVSSPPFLALRSYLPEDHPHKAREIGTEATPADFLDRLLDVVEALRPKLAPHGSLVFEIGDTYAGSGGGGGDYGADGMRAGQPRFAGAAAAARRREAQGDRRAWPMPKSLCGTPTLFAWSLAYGRNLLRPERTVEPWRIRNLVAWCRPNPPIGALADKFRPATTYLTVATMARDRYFDGDAVRVPARRAEPRAPVPMSREGYPDRRHSMGGMQHLDAPLTDYWEIPTEGYAGEHFATWPRALVSPIVASMCPESVCTVCGEPSRRIVERANAVGRAVLSRSRMAGADGRPRDGLDVTDGPTHSIRHTVGWTDCECEGGRARWRRGVVLDPFAGSGTTLAVATGHGRDAVGIDLDARNAELARERVGMFLDVED